MLIKPYKKLSFVYDFLYKSNNIFYKNYLSLIKEMVRENNINNPKILDIACGTGILINKLRKDSLFKKGVIEGVDSSKEILTLAKNKNKKIKFYNQEFTSLNTGKKYDIILSTFDSINYITTIKKLELSFNKIFHHLENNGFFIFDFNTPYKKINKPFTNNNIIFSNKITNNYWNTEIKIMEGIRVYKEQHRERLYFFEEIKKCLKKNGFKIKETYCNSINTKKTETKKCSRIIVIAKKIYYKD